MILGIDTSTGSMIAAIANDDGTVIRSVQKRASEAERGVHDARLASEIELLLKEFGAEQGVGQPDTAAIIRRVGVVIGPGSFTGLRIGLAFAKGYCYATGATLVALTQHQVLGAGIERGDYVLTPGYREGLYYIAPRTEAGNPHLIDEAALGRLSDRSFLLHPEFTIADRPALADSTTASLDIAAAICSLTANSMNPLGPEEIGQIEPMYLTEFKAGAR